MIELTAGKDDAGRRLDRIIRKALPDLSLSLIHRLLRQKKILVDNKPASPNSRIDQGMIIKVIADVNHETITVNKKKKNIINQRNIQVSNKNFRLKPPVPILWQGAGIIIFNKPSGLSTHGPNSLDTIVNDWLAGGGSPLPRSLSFKPGPLHRLDKPTSGVIVFSQTLEGAKMFSALLREHKLEKTYIAIVEGCIEQDEGTGNREQGTGYSEIIWQDELAHDKKTRKSFVETRKVYKARSPIPDPRSLIPISKQAITVIKTLASNGGYSLIEARIMTGRHHQIRAQAASHGHPLAGDIKYGGKPFPGSEKARGGCFFLHAWKIRFLELPDGFPGDFTGFIEAALPEAFLTQIEKLFSMEAIRGVVQETGKGRGH